MIRSRFLLFGLACMLLTAAACPPPAPVTANPADPTLPTTLWVQADIPGRPLANVYLNGGPTTAAVAGAGLITVTARTDDPDGGVKAIRLMMRQRRPRIGTDPLAAFALAAQTVSPATAGQPTQPSARVSLTLDAATLAGAGIEYFAEAENYAGGIVRSPTLSLCVQNRRLQLHVIPLSDDDGSHAPSVTAEQFADAVHRANRVFCGSGIQFGFDPATGWAPDSNTTMNRDQTIRADGNALAATMPQRLVVFLRWGGDPANVTGNGNAYPPPGSVPPRNFGDETQNYVALPSLYPAGALSHITLQNGAFMAHELGHYLGLYHTFPGWNGTHPVYGGTPATGAVADQALLDYLRTNGGTIATLDGDLIGDTPPDPGVILFDKRGINPCTNPAIAVSGTSGGTPLALTFRPDVANAMSYYGLCDSGNDPRPRDFSPGQAVRMHLVLGLSPRSGLIGP